jgi:hypothetical protein
MRKAASRLRELTPAEGGFLAAAWLAAPIVGAGLRFAGLKRTVAWIERGAETLSSAARWSGSGLSPERAAQLVAWAYRLQWVRGGCLPQALVQYGLQRSTGSQVRLVVGVRKDDQQGAPVLAAHAWVEAMVDPLADKSFGPIFDSATAGAQHSNLAPEHAGSNFFRVARRGTGTNHGDDAKQACYKS